ncbi:MAG TPA: transglutaminase family protein [Candidatus Binataceae bacterium]|nr:transglutaminase family protein [Candidatus Binataceae bacterium]
MRFRIRHVTRFTYDAPAYESHNEVRLTPRPSPRQRTLGFRLEVIPRAAVIDYRDAFTNVVHAISVHEPHRELVVVADSLVEREAPRMLETPRHRFSEFLAGDAERSQHEYDFLHQSRYIPFSEPLKRLFWQIRPQMNEPVAAYTARVVAWVRDQFAYEPGTTDVNSDINTILSTGAGVCQDFAHLTLGLLRLAGVPARYVSGYLAPRSNPDRPRPLGEQATHAWLEALLPEAGWIGFDPTHGGRTTDHHLRVSVGRDYADVTPLRGVYRSLGSKQTMRVSLDISAAEGEADGGSTDFGATQQ